MVHDNFEIELVNTFFNCGAKVRQYFLSCNTLSLFFGTFLSPFRCRELAGEELDGFTGK